MYINIYIYIFPVKERELNADLGPGIFTYIYLFDLFKIGVINSISLNKGLEAVWLRTLSRVMQVQSSQASVTSRPYLLPLGICQMHNSLLWSQ